MKFQVYWFDEHCVRHLVGEFETLEAAKAKAEIVASRSMSWERVWVYQDGKFLMEMP